MINAAGQTSAGSEMRTSATQALSPGFFDPVFDSQKCFRVVLDALAHPGRPYPLDVGVRPPSPLNGTAAALVLTLADFETPVWLDPNLAGCAGVSDWIRFHTGARIVEESYAARFAVISDAKALPPLSGFSCGSQEYPDESATLIIQVDALQDGAGPTLTGPGIETENRLQPAPLSAPFWLQAIDNAALYPRGIDFIFATADALAALPRSTQIELEA